MKNKTQYQKFQPWLIWSLAALFYGYEFLIRVSPNVMVPQIMKDFGVQAAALGIMASCFYWAYAAAQIPAGLLVDRFGAKRLLITGALLVAAGNFIFALSDTVYLGSIGRLLVGLGAAFAFICTLKLITEWFPPYRFALLAGLTNFLGYTGATLGGEPLNYLLQFFSWRDILHATGVFGIIIAILIYLFVRNRPKGKTGSGPKSTLTSVTQGLKTVLKNPQSWYNAIFTGCMVAPTSTFAALWGVPYLVHVDQISYTAAAGASSMIFIGVFAGSPIWGLVSDSLRLRKPPLIFAAVTVMIVTLLILYFSQLPIWILYTLCFLFGFFQSAHVLNFAIAYEINRPAANGAAVGFTNMCLILGGAIFQPVVGILLAAQWDGLKNIHGVATYTISNYHWSMAVLPLLQFIGLLIVVFLIKETHCKPRHMQKRILSIGSAA